MSWQDQIVIDPAVANGRPTLRTSQVQVLPLVESLLGGTRLDQLRREFPELTDREVNALISYTRDRIVDRQPTLKQKIAVIMELVGLTFLAIGYGLSLSTLFTYQILCFILFTLVITWFSRQYQLLDYTGNISSFRIKPAVMIGAAVVGFGIKNLFFEIPFVPTLLLGVTMLSISELCNENRYIRWLSFGKTINVVLMSLPISLLIILVILHLLGSGTLNLYESLLLLGYSIFGGLITALTYRRFVSTQIVPLKD